MSWIESHQSLSRHRKTLRVAAILKVDRYKLIGHLHELWWWGLDNADADGHLMGIGEVEIAAAAGWPDKQSHAFVEALVVAGFLDEDSQCSQGGAGLTLHNWYRYAGKLNEQIDLRRESNRAAQERRRHRLREEKGTRESALTNADGQHDIDDSQHPTVPNLTVPNPDPSDQLAAKRTPSPRKSKVPTPLTEEETAKLHTEFGTSDQVLAHIEQAMAHEAALKYPATPYRYVQKWVRDELAKQPRWIGTGTGTAASEPYVYRPRMSPFVE